MRTFDATDLAAWTTLPFESFRDIYGVIAGEARSWPTLEAAVRSVDSNADAAAVVAEACREANAHGFLEELACAVARNERDFRARAPSEVAAFLARLRRTGELQAIRNRRRGLKQTAVFARLDRASQSLSIVFHGGEQVGTAFLVQPDVVLTAAHVVLADGPDGAGHKAWKPATLLENLIFSFAPEPGGGRTRLEVPPAARGALLASALPHAKPRRDMIHSLDPPADQNLDFALVRLARPIAHLPPLDIIEPAEPEPARDFFVLGFPGGNTAMYDSDAVTEVCAHAGRVTHDAGAAAGMSGGCCFDHEGNVVALHEGALSDGGPNRGVLLSTIRVRQKQNGTDPLIRRRVSSVELAGGGLSDSLYKAGLRLGGPNQAMAWRQMVQATMGLATSPGDGVTFPAFHPWFARREVEIWFESKKSSDRFSYINGPEGCGKSFCAQIIRGKLDLVGGAPDDLIVFSATRTGAWSLDEAIGQAMAFDPGLRTTAGVLRYDDVPAIVEAIRRRDRTSETPAFVVIDFETDITVGGVRSSPWRALIEALTLESWARVALIGLGEEERLEIDSVIFANPQTQGSLAPVQIDLGYLGLTDLQTYARALILSRGLQVSPEQAITLASKVAEIWNQPAFVAAGLPLQTAKAALAAYMLRSWLDG